VLDKPDWNGALTPERLRLPEVKVDTWGGWVWINMDPHCEPLRDYLEPAASMLDPFELEKMRYRRRPMVPFRLQLEDRDGGIHRKLPGRGYAPTTLKIR
jgi:phenylpropionate dioxygenase-like ring-hydroxylating dioxygenase large terminal subunit